MGLLDDAIREHLDLKRRRGGDPAEIERAEREALGPVRRKGGQASLTADPELDALIEADDDELPGGVDEPGSAYDEPGSAYDEPDDGTAVDLAEGDLPAAELPRLDDEPGAPDEPRPPHFVDEDEEPFADDDEHETRVMRIPDQEPPPTQAPEPTMSDATSEYDVEEALAADREEGDDAEAGADVEEGTDGETEKDEDMLEETPEFLQDTPDHDRLWFEQRPPRDFDFDG